MQSFADLQEGKKAQLGARLQEHRHKIEQGYKIISFDSAGIYGVDGKQTGSNLADTLYGAFGMNY